MFCENLRRNSESEFAVLMKVLTAFYGIDESVAEYN